MGLFKTNEEKALGFYEKAEEYYKKNEYEKMIPYYEKAADLGHLQSMHCLGYSYRNGEGVKVNNEKAYYWYSMAADKGYVKSIYAKGYCLLYGEGVGQDTQKGLELIKLAAQKNHPLALYKLGKLYYEGESMPKDKTFGLSFIGKAAILGNKPAIKFLSEINGTTFALENGHVENGLSLNYRKSFERNANYNDGIALVKTYREYGLFSQAADIMNIIKEDARELNNEAIKAAMDYYRKEEDYISLLEVIYMIVHNLNSSDASDYAIDVLAQDEKHFMNEIEYYTKSLNKAMEDKYYDLDFDNEICLACEECSKYLDVVRGKGGVVTSVRTPASKENRIRFSLAQDRCLGSCISITDR